jgi:hypothetical protein
MVASSVFIAFGLVLPIVFHMTGVMGSVFLPMHIPVLIAGLFLGLKAGFFTGLLTPILSSSITGMPPIMPTLPVMTAELAIYGLAGGYLYHRTGLSLVLSLIGAMVLGRIMAVIVVHILGIAVGIKLQPMVYLTGAIMAGLPGIILQLIFIPFIVNRLDTAFRKTK